MSWTLLLPAGAVGFALIALALGLRLVERELISLRVSLRRSGASAVAAHDLQRTARQVQARGIEMRLDANRRVTRPWRSRSHRHHR
ncbi:MAG: hypothetical protein P8L46_12485 [Acidimicrobiales bacterium]|nr:hypothetical protein [Acidimicrobiales bacterium]MDG2218848.1 hypothetical protein [Acidimicrobiales bacterium]